MPQENIRGFFLNVCKYVEHETYPPVLSEAVIKWYYVLKTTLAAINT